MNKLYFAKSIVIKDFADVVYNLFILKKLTQDSLGREQCSSNRYRSIIDCKDVCRGYNIEGDISDAIKSIRRYGSEDRVLSHHFCSDVGREVHFVFSAVYLKPDGLDKIREILEKKNINFKVNG